MLYPGRGGGYPVFYKTNIGFKVLATSAGGKTKSSCEFKDFLGGQILSLFQRVNEKEATSHTIKSQKFLIQSFSVKVISNSKF